MQERNIQNSDDLANIYKMDIPILTIIDFGFPLPTIDIKYTEIVSSQIT